MSNWQPPNALPDLRRVGIIALDSETRDGGLLAGHGSAWPWGDGYVCGVSVAYRAEDSIRAHYFPIRHPNSQNFDREQLRRWLEDLITSDVRIVTQNGLYDWGWLGADFGLEMPPSDRLEEIGALATLVDENRYRYALDALCAWRGLPGKDETLLKQAAIAAGFPKKAKPQAFISQLPAHAVGPYAEADAISTLALFESLDPVLDREGTRGAYRLEVDLLPMVLEMRRRGIRIDTAAAEQARDLLLQKRDAVFTELSEKLGRNVGMAEIGRTQWLAEAFDQEKISYPRTEKGSPSFTAGNSGWMPKHPHWLPQLVVKADRYNNAAVNVLETYILGHTVRGRVHAEVHPHRSDEGGTRSLRFSYSSPPLQLMPKHNEELAPLIRGVFLPEEGEVWAEPDVSQQEFRLLVHYAARHKLPRADAWVARYREDPNTDAHQLAAEFTGLVRQSAKGVNFAKIYGAGVRKFAAMTDKTVAEAEAIIARYDRELPFVTQLSQRCERAVRGCGYLTLYDGARRHFNHWAPGGKWQKGAGPCEREEAIRRTQDPGHPWYGQRLWRANTRLAFNALIQGSAARHTKLWMRACWREGIVPLLQMHDALECSVSSREQAEMVARLGCEVVTLEVPMQVDLKFGRNWADAKHSWQELHGEISHHVEPAGGDRERTPREDAKFFNGSDSAPSFIPADNTSVPLTGTSNEELEIPPAHICARCKLDPPDGTERRSAYDDLWLHPRCEDELLHERLAQEGLESIRQSTEQEHAPAAPNPPSGNRYNDFDSYPHGERDDSGRKVSEFIYRDLKGAPYLKVAKYVTNQGKKFFPQYRVENSQWVKGKPSGPSIPYRLPELLAAPTGAPVWICEGEKDVENLAALGLVATTNPGGAGKWTPELNKWLAGFSAAYVLEDNDEAGHKHAAQLAAALLGTTPDVRVLMFRELPEHGDVSDWLAAGGTREQLIERAKQSPGFAALESTCAADEELNDLEWIWPGRFAIGKIGLIAGLPDEGKGQVISDIIARITRGASWPCNEGCAPLGNAILLTAEDDINDTIVPRLEAAGADRRRVTLIKMMREAGKKRMFSLVSDLDSLRQKIVEVDNVKLVVIDPISAYLGIGKIDSFRATDVRAVLGPLKELASELRVAVLAIMHFNKKIDITNVLLRISDSLAYGAAARHVYGIVDDPDNQRKLFVKGKNNLAPAEQKTLAYSFDTREVGISKRTGAPIVAPHIVWHPEPVDISASEAMQAAAESKSPSARDNAKHFLEALLSNEPVEAKDVHEAAKANGISRNTLYRAKDELGIEIKQDGLIVEGHRSWRWHLPNQAGASGCATPA